MSDETALPTRMTAMVLTGHGGYEQLSYRTDFLRPSPLAGEVLIRVGAAGINNTDINTRIGWYSDRAAEDGSVTDGSWTGEALGFPRVQGADVCGHVVALGQGLTRPGLASGFWCRPVWCRFAMVCWMSGLAQSATAALRNMSQSPQPTHTGSAAA